MADWCKTGSSSKPTYVMQCLVLVKQTFRWKICKYLGYLTALLVVLIAYYVYLNTLYIVDEIYDIQGPKELYLSEKLVIRVYENNLLSEINKFVLHYSICPIVQEVQIISRHASHPPDEFFKYTTAHSKVSFKPIGNETVFEQYFYDQKIETEGVLLLDLDTFVPCSDLYFAHSVWRSSKDSAVGFFPRLIKESSKSSSTSRFSYLSSSSVFYEKSFSLLLQSGMLVKRHYLKELSKSSISKEFAERNPECSRWLLSLYILHTSNVAPVWVDTSVRVEPTTLVDYYPLSQSFKRDKNTKLRKVPDFKENENCINKISELYGIKHIPRSFSKATKAKSHLFW